MTEPLTRREFTLQWALSVLGGAVITITGCGDSSPGPSAPTPATTTTPPAPSGDVQGTISANHGHTATITAAELAAGAAVTGVFATMQLARQGLLSRRYRKIIRDLEAEVHQLRNLPLSEEEATLEARNSGGVDPDPGRALGRGA